MSSDEALQKNEATTESSKTEAASSPEAEQQATDSTPESQSDSSAAEPSAEPTAPDDVTTQTQSFIVQPPPVESLPEPAAPVAETPSEPTVESVETPVSAAAPDPPAVSVPEPAAPVAETPSEPAPVAETPSEPAPVAESPAKPEVETPVSAAAPEPPAVSTPEPAPVEPPAESAPQSSSDQTPAESRPRPQLNPTVDPNAAKPVPSIESSPTPPQAPPPVQVSPPVETSSKEQPQSSIEAEAAAAQSAPPPSAQTAPSATPAEVPKAADLDADMEAQIAALQASDDAAGSQPVPVPQQPAAESGEGAPEAPQEVVAPTSEEDLEPGQKLPGKVQSISGDDVFFDVGFRSPALVSLRQFDPAKPPAIGQQHQLVVDKVNAAEGLILANLPRGRRKIQGNWDAVAAGQVVDCMVTKTNKGGLEITISSLRGFLPASQVDLHYVSDLETYVGQKLTVKITEANRAKKNLIVSRRAYLREEREAHAEEIWGSLEVGQTKKGQVKTIKDYGAFIDIGGVDGFLHIGEISWTRIRHPSDVLSEGQEVDVQIVTLDPDKKRIGLGMRQLSQNPWDSVTQDYPQGTSVSGRVTRTTDFGAFVELEPGVEGLVHISELDYRRVNKVTDVLNVGDETELQVLELDLGRKRISLSLKALKEKPPELDKKPAKKSDEDMAPSAGESYNRKRKGPLKGGTGGSDGGGLFGNPGDFT